MNENSDGVMWGTSSGGVAGDHASGAVRPVAVGPSTNGQVNTIRLHLIPIACWRVDDIRFDFDSSFVRPEISTEIAHLAFLMKQHPGSPISLFGHADPVGDDEYNKVLSGRRATAVYAMLTRDVELWDRLYTVPFSGDTWANTALADMLARLGYAPGADNMNSPQTTQALKEFQKAAGLAANGYADKTTRTRLFVAYMDKVCRDSEGQPFVLTKNDFLAQGADPDGKGDYQGCGEFCPILMFSAAENEAYKDANNRDSRNKDNEPNRRVVAFLFRPQARVQPDKWPCGRAKEGTQNCRKRFWSDAAKRRSFQENRREYAKDKDTIACRFYDRMAGGSPCEAALNTFRIRLLDPFSRPMPYAPYRVTRLQGQGEESPGAASARADGRADVNGWAVIRDVTKPAKVRVEWRYPLEGEENGNYQIPYSYSREIYLCISEDPKDEEAAAGQRLYNLGYAAGKTLADNIRKFQRAYALEETGRLEDIREDLWQFHDSTEPPPLNCEGTYTDTDGG